jgi:superfamily I DNA/RNA helicase
MSILYDRANKLKSFLNSCEPHLPVKDIIENLFPKSDKDLININKILNSLIEPNDDIKKLYQKFIDQIRTIPSDDNDIRIMSIMGSKGLDSDYVFILGCNDGNIPGKNKSIYLNENDWEKEQRRLLYVGFTRAKKSLTVTWTEYIPFEQALSQNTSTIRTVTGRDRKKYSQVAICRFLDNTY